MPPINFAALAEALLARAEQLVPAWLPGGKTSNGEYLVSSWWRSEKSPSLSIRLTGQNAGRWADFGGDHKGGDLISLYAAIHGLDMGHAAVELARQLGMEDLAGVQRAPAGAGAPPRPPPPPPPPAAPKADRESDGWRPCVPVPEFAPEAPFTHQYRQVSDIEHTATYRMDGALLGYVVRFRKSDGGKETLPYTWCVSARDGTMRWAWKQWDEPRPLYLPGGISPVGLYKAGLPARTVVVVEGEKKADVLQQLLDAGAPGVYLVASWPGGSKAWKKATWDWLAGCAVMLWPDCDGKREPLSKAEREQCVDDTARALAQQAKPLLPEHKQVGMVAMRGIGALLRDQHMCKVQLLPIPAPGSVADGWDCADAILTDGWDFERVLGFFATAIQLPDDAVADKPAAKKIDGLADAPDSPSDDDSVEIINGRRVPRWLAYYWDSDRRRWLTSRKMVISALERDPALAPVLALNELSNNIDAQVDWPWLHGRAGPITGTVDLMLGDYLTRTYGLPSIARAALMEAIETVAHARRYHPVRDYLRGLKHDGTTRIDKWLIYAIGETPETITAQHRAGAKAVIEYLTLVGRYWLLGMVNRVMDPGCKFDYCPVLEGPGGFGKSTLVELLAGSQFFSDTHFDVSRGKEGQEQVQGLWVYEIAELANFGKAEIGLIKAFITAKVDRYRPSYGRTVESYQRQCVLVGTTNESTYLRDRTGNRRFWPIPVRSRIRIEWVRKVRDQLFAEAYALWLTGARFTPTYEDEERLFVPMQESRLVETAVTSEMWNVLTRTPKPDGIGSVVNGLTDFVTISQLTVALGVDAAKSNAALEGQIRSWLEHEGWTREKRQINGVRAWGYARPDQWPPIEVAAQEAPAAESVTQQGGSDDEPF